MRKLSFILSFLLFLYIGIYPQSMYTNGNETALSAGASMINVYSRYVYPSYAVNAGVSLFGYVDLGAELIAFNGRSKGFVLEQTTFKADINVKNKGVGFALNTAYIEVLNTQYLLIGATIFKRMEIPNSMILKWFIPSISLGAIPKDYITAGVRFAFQKDFGEHFGLVITPGINTLYNYRKSYSYNTTVHMILGMEMIVH